MLLPFAPPSANTGLRHTISRSPGNSGELPGTCKQLADRGRTQGRDPAQAFLADTRPGERPRSPTSTTRCNPKRLRILSTCAATVFGSRWSLRIPRPAIGQPCGAQQPEHDLQGAALAVAAVAAARQRAGVSLEITGSQVVQHKRVVTQMAPRQALFDTPLAPYQPVHRCVEFILVDGLQPQDLAEGGDSRARAVASLERASMTRATIMATTRSRRRLAGRAMGMQAVLREPRTATWPCG